MKCIIMFTKNEGGKTTHTIEPQNIAIFVFLNSKKTSHHFTDIMDMGCKILECCNAPDCAFLCRSPETQLLESYLKTADNSLSLTCWPCCWLGSDLKCQTYAAAFSLGLCLVVWSLVCRHIFSTADRNKLESFCFSSNQLLTSLGGCVQYLPSSRRLPSVVF